MSRLDGKTIVLCFPAEPRHVSQIQSAAPGAQILNSTQQDIDTHILRADIFCGHAKEKELPWDDVVRQGRLQWIQSSAAGLDHCLVPSVIASDIRVTSASGLFADQVAEQTAALLAGLVRSLPAFFRAQQKKEFVRLPTGDLHGKTAGIVGFGGNGRRIAEVLSAFKVRIVATDIFPIGRPDHVSHLWDADRLPELLGMSDIVILCVPLNRQTRFMIDGPQLRACKEGAILINVARGQIVREQALADALRSGKLSAAGLDVTEVEPLPESSPLWDMENVIITPHVGAQSADRVDVTAEFFCQNLRRFEEGLPLANEVDKQLGFPTPESSRRRHGAAVGRKQT